MSKTTEAISQAVAEAALVVATYTGGVDVSALQSAHDAQTVVEEQKVEVDTRVEQPTVSSK